MVLIFKKTLRSTDVTCRLSVGTRSLKDFPPFEGGQHSQFLMFEDEASRRWRFRLSIRRRGHPRPVLSTGWPHFVAFMNLQVGDEVLFFKEVDDATGEVTYKIRRFYNFL